MYESLFSSERLNHQSYEQTTSIEEIEDQMDDWLQDRTAAKKKVVHCYFINLRPWLVRNGVQVQDLSLTPMFICQAAEWTDDELSLLSRLMVKFPGGMPGRWEKIAHELGRSVSDVSLTLSRTLIHDPVQGHNLFDEW